MAKDLTKYQFNGETLAKNRLVLAVVKSYVEQHQPTLEQLISVFPKSLQGSQGVFCTEVEFNERLESSGDVNNRFFIKTSERLAVGDSIILVSTQWGSGNIERFVKCAKSLGFDIEKVVDPAGKDSRGIKAPKASLQTSPSNIILYGPPGTGKTYHTIEESVRLADPEGFDALQPLSANTTDYRDALKQRYGELVACGRIRFVTFHQSFGYEEFVEGLSATTQDGKISYEIKDGIFKQISSDATENALAAASKDAEPTFSDLWQELIADLDEDGIKIATKKAYFTITGCSDTTIYFDKASGESAHSLSISSLREIFYGRKTIKGGLAVYYNPLVAHLKKQSQQHAVAPVELEQYVLVIDEINRGNISKVFGELITLIEPSKRAGQPEALSLRLPYSKDSFSVPSNLHLIGTMNTADRSLALMDTALRRRFDFKPMMPDTSVLEGAEVAGIDLAKLLATMNRRIEFLYDRDHTLGHAFFIPVRDTVKNGDESSGLKQLELVFRNKILPLLEEYFFEDWQKIRLVLGDEGHNKPEHLQFVQETNNSESASDLFGQAAGELTLHSDGKSYQINDEAFAQPDVYRWIMGKPEKVATSDLDDETDD